MKTFHTILHIILLIILSIFFIGGCMGFLGCKVERHITSTKTDSTTVKASDSTHVVKSDSTASFVADWWKETVLFGRPLTLGANKYFYSTIDTVVIQNNPVAIIKEGGKIHETVRVINYDSIRKLITDSLNVNKQVAEKESKTKVLSVGHILLICSGLFLLFLILVRSVKPKWL